ncbi:PEP-CTERM sorting domain-containing protein [Paludisphaera sp.]|uniref:PEP-CTERM sorting domain-containing protein n=1 Tax=Paludisphaera sp. TaxID=2017432 RepID=UPI00301BFB62
MSMRMIRLAVAAALAIGFAGRGEAGTITFNFSGGSGASAFTGSFWYDLDTPDLNPNPNGGDYEPSAAFPMGFSVDGPSGSYSAVADTGIVSVAHYGSISINLFSADGGAFYFSIHSQWAAGGPDDLPASYAVTPDSFGSVAVIVNRLGIREEGDLTSVTTAAAAVPEPASLAMAMVGAVGLLALARRRPA